jgi:uncharacterized membrane protein YraQ (UPF0718 family)
VLVALAVPLVAVAAGTLLALAGGARPRVLVPVRSFALAAVLFVVVTHLLPEAIEAGGPWALVVFAAGVAAPQLIGRIGTSVGRHARVATELGFLGVVLHQIGDGLALGALRGESAVVIAIGVHTVPLAAAVTLGMVELHGTRGAIVRAAVLGVATIGGVVVAGTGGTMLAADVAPWINAAVAGLLVHVLSHDLPTPARAGTAPPIELLAIAAGVAVPILAAHGEHGTGGELIAALRELSEIVAVPLAIGLVAAIGLDVIAARARARLFGHGSAAGGLAAAALAGTCSCRVGPAAGAVREHARPAGMIAFLLAAPELGVDTILLGTQVFGLETALIRIGAAVAIAIAAGLIVGRVAATQTGHDHDHDHGHDHAPRSWLTTIDEVIIHTGPRIAIGLVSAALVLVALPADALAGSRWLAIGVAAVVAVPAYICAPAATPLAAVLIMRGLPPGAAIAGLVLGAASNRGSLALVARAYGRAAAVAVIAVAAAIAVGAGVMIELTAVVSDPRLPLPHDGPIVTAAACLLGLAALRGLWRYGLAAWLEPMLGSEHRHHQHADGAPCEPGCHDH